MNDAEMWRSGLFLGGFALWAVAESVWPRRERRYPRRSRWPTNLSMGALGALALRLVALVGVPFAAVEAARWAESHRLGLLNAMQMPLAMKTLLSVVLLDAVIWAQHRAFHLVPWLWRWHRVHHADCDLDVSSALRFHPGEILMSMAVKSVTVVALGAPLTAVIAFEALLNGTAMFNHANLRLHPALDGLLRRLLVTPDLHRIHHSTHRDEQDSNFGFNLSVWDQIAGTYRALPRDGQTHMVLGLADFQDDAPVRLSWSLRLPALPIERSLSGETERP